MSVVESIREILVRLDVSETNPDTAAETTHGSTDGLLYHYTSFAGLMAILFTERLRLGTYVAMNDPRENKRWVSEALASAGGGSSAVREEADRLIQRSVRLVCFSTDHVVADEDPHGHEPSNLLHRGWARPRMWSQYADGHSGACLVFDARDIWRRLGKTVEPYQGHGWYGNRRIKYVDRRRHSPTDFSRFTTAEEFRNYFDEALTERVPEHGLKFFNDLYFQKSRDWLSEYEWRFSCALWKLPKDQMDSPLSTPYGHALKAVILGDRFASPQGICDALKRQEGPVPSLFQCEWAAGIPELSCV